MRHTPCAGCERHPHGGSNEEDDIDLADTITTISRRIDERLAADGTPGVVVAITDRERTLHVRAHGWADLAARTPMRPDHLLEIGSISKSFAAIVALQLSAEGLLDLHAPVTDYLPWFEVQSEFEPITTHHLLTHTAGLVAGSLGFYDGRAEAWALRRTRTGAPPGTFFHYSNVGYETVGLIVTAVTGQPFHEELRRRVLIPLDMTSSEPDFTNDVRPRLAVGHMPAADDRPFLAGTSALAPATWFVGDTADGAICATGEDMARYLRLWLSGGGGAYDGVLTREGFAAMTTSALESTDPKEEGYGYGIGITSIDGRAVLQHSGGMVGYVAQAIAETDAGLAVIVLANGPANVGTIARESLDLVLAAHGKAPEPTLAPLARDDIADADDLAGTYRGTHDEVVIEAAGHSLVLRHGDDRLPMHRTSTEDLTFVVDHPNLGVAPYELTRHGEAGTTLVHGRHWFAGPGFTEASPTDHPPAWDRFAGLYRAHNPWNPCLRILVRHGELWMIHPGSGTGERLEPDGEDTFRLADDDRLPERVRFHSFAEGIPICVEVEGFDYYRASDPPSCWNDTA